MRIAILGGGESGVGAALLAKKLGFTAFVSDFGKIGDAFKKGTITNPEDGKVYDCRLKLDEDNSNKLQVRGYIAFFYRTQYWIRAED